MTTGREFPGAGLAGTGAAGAGVVRGLAATGGAGEAMAGVGAGEVDEEEGVSVESWTLKTLPSSGFAAEEPFV